MASMSAHTDAHPAERTLGSERVVILGYNYNDASLARRRHLELQNQADAALASATAHPGSVAGMAAAKVYVTPAAHRGENYDAARRNFTRKGAELIHLQGE